MENASKALVMAGGILISLMVIGALVLMFSNLSNYQNKNDASTKSSQIAEFNNQYSPYDKDNLNLMELKSLYNKIESNNVKNPDKQIISNIEEMCTKIGIDIKAEFKNIDDEHKQNRVFKCTTVEYDNTGRINMMTFEKVK